MSSVAAKGIDRLAKSETLCLVRKVTSVWLRIEKWLLKGGGQRRRVKGQLFVRTSALSSIEAAHTASGAVGRSSRDLIGRSIKSKNKIIENRRNSASSCGSFDGSSRPDINRHVHQECLAACLLAWLLALCILLVFLLRG